jgi:hypothetical protein
MDICLQFVSKGINIHQKTKILWMKSESPVENGTLSIFIPLFIGFQSSVWWCRILLAHPFCMSCSPRGIHGPGFPHPQPVLFICCFSTSLHHFPPFFLVLFVYIFISYYIPLYHCFQVYIYIHRYNSLFDIHFTHVFVSRPGRRRRKQGGVDEAV